MDPCSTPAFSWNTKTTDADVQWPCQRQSQKMCVHTPLSSPSKDQPVSRFQCHILAYRPRLQHPFPVGCWVTPPHSKNWLEAVHSRATNHEGGTDPVNVQLIAVGHPPYDLVAFDLGASPAGHVPLRYLLHGSLAVEGGTSQPKRIAGETRSENVALSWFEANHQPPHCSGCCVSPLSWPGVSTPICKLYPPTRSVWNWRS